MNLRRLASAVRALTPVVNLVADALEAEGQAFAGPEIVTQHNVEQVVGLPPRTFLEMLDRPCFDAARREPGRASKLSPQGRWRRRVWRVKTAIRQRELASQRTPSPWKGRAR